MKILPHTFREWSNAVSRVISICIGLCGAVCVWAGDRAGSLPGAWYVCHDWQVTSLMVSTGLAGILVLWSLVTLVGPARWRDTDYGITGLVIGLVSLTLWLFPDNAKPR